MEEKDSDFYKLNIISVIKESFHLYKENLGIFLNVSFLILLIRLFNVLSSFLKEVLGASPIGALSGLVHFIVLLPLFFLELKLYAIMNLCIIKRYYNKQVTVKQEFRTSSEKVWAYINASLLFSLMLIPILLVGLVVYFSVQITAVKWLIILALAILIIYLSTIYNFAPLSAIIETKKISYFERSKEIVQGNFWRILIILAITRLVSMLPGQFITNLNPWFKTLSIMSQYGLKVVHNILMMFILPLVNIIDVVIYIALNNKSKKLEQKDVLNGNI